MALWCTLTIQFAVLLLPNCALAQSEEKHFVHSETADIPGLSRLRNFSYLYVGQWGAYFLTQRGTIQERGSFNNWRQNPFRPHFDFDGFNYNVFAHSIVGQLYYQYYRSRGYSEGASFLWTFLSSAAFEFSIETVTERPSFQDVYQTPVFGTLVGMGFERISLFLHSTDFWPARVLGYIFNPFSLIPNSSYQFKTAPILNPQAPGATVSWNF